MKKYTKYLSVVLSVVLLLLCGMTYISADEESASVDEGYVNIVDYGADFNDKSDDSAAFEAALATGKNIYLPEGSYYVSKTIVVSDRIIRGSEMGKTKIYGIMPDKTDPIILAEGISSLYDLYICYPTKEECQDAKQGEKVAIQLGSAEKGLQPGSVLRSIYINQVGTGLYNPTDAACNGVLFENFLIYPFYRGVDLQGEDRIANSFSNVYINNHVTDNATVIDSGFAAEGSSYGETYQQINVEHCTYTTAAMVLKNAHNFNIAVIHFEGVNLANDNAGWMFVENSSGYIGGFTNYFTYIDTYKNSMIRFGDSEGTSKIFISTLHNRGLNAPDTISHTDWIAEIADRGVEKGMSVGGDTAADFRLFRRADGAKGDYEVTLDYYSYYYYAAGDAPYYLDYMDENEDLKLTVIHEAGEATH